MAEFDDKLNSLLSNPEAMNQIMKMSQSLMGGEGQAQSGDFSGNPGGPAESGSPPPVQPSEGSWGAQQNGGFPPPPSASAGAGQRAPDWEQPAAGSWGSPSQSASPHSGQTGPDLSFLSGLGNIDPKTVASLLPVLRELGEAQNSNARQLLFALRPYLKPERQDKVERALQLARLFRVGKKFLLKGDGHV